MPATDIVIRGAREHNLRSVDVTLPRNKLICLTGVSGSGKSSLAFDTLYAEGQRRYVESLSTFARQFLGQMPKPEVDHISGLSPSISISQKSSGNNPRSTVGTITEIYDFLRVLYARIGHGNCPTCGKPITAQTREQIIARIMAIETGTQYAVLAPVIRGQKGEYKDLFEDLRKQGFVRARVDGKYVSFSDDLSLDRQMRHNIEVVVDRLKAAPSVRGRLAEAVDTALGIGKGNIIAAVRDDDEESRTDNPVHPEDEEETDKIVRPTTKRRAAGTQPGDIILSSHFACTDCGISFDEPTPQLFSFNSPSGMCLTCDGLGEFFSFDADRLVPDNTKSFEQGCIELIGSWKDLGRWKRHIYRGVAETMERKLGLDEGTLLEKPWKELTKKQRDIWLWGTGDQHITYTWRAGKSAQKYGGTFDGLIPELLEKYNTSKSVVQIRQLEQYMSIIPCPDCQGRRLNPQACAVTVQSASPRFTEKPHQSLPEVCALSITDTVEFFSDVVLAGNEKQIAEQVLKEIRGRLGFLLNVGLEYLSLERTAPTLSGGESQRIRLAGQVGCGLVGVLYILDEPSIGLHPRDNQRLLDTLAELRDLGNTVVVVEHDEDTMRAADHLIDFGPGPGVRGGEVVAIGTADQIAREPRSATGAFLSGKRKIEVPLQRRLSRTDIPVRRGQNSKDKIVRPTHPTQSEVPKLRVIGARHNNLKNIDVDIPLGAFVCVTGASGSGKSSLVNDILAESLLRDLMGGKGQPGDHDRIEGVDQLDKLIVIDQSPIGRTPRSNPGTYIKLFDDIRSLYTQLPESKRRGYKPGRFSFNVQGGRCEACEGNGSNRLEMDFLADVWVTCPVCNGHRFNRETLQVMYKEKNIAQVLEMDVQEAMAHFENIPSIHHKLSTLHAVGLDYIKIGQPSPTLSGGEAQRIKLARELVKKSTGRTLYLLDEPTTGLHFADIELLLKVLHEFVDAGNTVLIVEHNLDVAKTADWIIDIGPDGGAGGGRIVACGTPEEVARNADSHTGQVLAPTLGIATNGKRSTAPGSAGGSTKRQAKTNGKRSEATHITVRGARQHNLRSIDVKIPRDEMTVFCGPSGSGKTSLAMDTIYAEGQRRYVESLSSYARQFVGQMQKPQVDHIDGLSPAIAIEQRNAGHTPRSTVGTVTEIYDYFRILFARLGQPHCPECDIPIGTQTSDQIVDKLLEEPSGTKLYIMAPVEVAVGEQYEALWDSLRGGGYIRVRIDGETHSLEQTPTIDRRRKHAVEVIVDRIVVRPDARSRIAGSIENALALGKGVVHVAHPDDDVPEPRWPVRIHSQHLACEKCGRSFDTLNPHNFSFNSSLGWCPACEGLGTQIGANPAALLRDANLTLDKGALLVWPDVSLPVSQLMLTALAAHTGVPINVPYNDLSPRQRRTVLFGTEEEWIAVYPAKNPRQSRVLTAVAKGPLDSEKTTTAPGSAGGSEHVQPLFRFQYKGLYPALEEASKLSPRHRALLEQFVGEIDCSECGGSRLRDAAAAVRFRDRTLDQIGRTSLGELITQIKKWKLAPNEKKVAGELIREIDNRLTFLVDVGLEYLTLGRAAPTLSGGEAQRIRLASQVGSGLCGVLYVLDEPTIGLHPRDNNRLIVALKKLRDLGNTLLIVEHDREVIASSDGLFDFGPGSGRLGGQILASGTPEKVSKTRGSVTGPYLNGKKAIGIPKVRRAPIGFIEVVGARHNNLKNINVKIPLGVLTAFTGVSGSGKSSLVEDILYNQLAKMLHRASTVPGAHESIRGIEQINKVIRVDQQPLGNTPTSNPATYTGVFDLIRTLFSQLPESKLRGYTARRFSFNVAGGRCETCEGNGQICIQMHFLPDVWVECETCHGLRYNPDVLEVRFHGKSIADVLNMSCGQAVELFSNIPKIRRILQTLCDVGLDYLTLGQSAPTLSGGEAQRVKLAAELARPDTGQTLYLLDEPTTGLHFDDLAKLLEVLNRLVDHGNTVVVIEHNLDVIKTADWIIDIGPEAGAGGGTVVACGTPEQLVDPLRIADCGLRIKKGKKSKSSQSEIRNPKSEIVSHTAIALAPVLASGPFVTRKLYNPEAAVVPQPDDLEIDDVGRDTRMPWEVDGRQWHTKDRVARDGRDTKWDGRILDAIERKIQKAGDFAETNWNNRSIVEITSAKKSDGWFFHAITGERWLVKLKFRTAKKTFDSSKLVADLDLKPLNDIDEIEAYGRGPRVKCKTLRGPWQEVQIDVHSWAEVDTPAFWSFLERAIAGFNKFTERITAKPEDVMPWKVLGQKWHLSKKGFPPGKKTAWKPEVLEELLEMLSEAVPDGQFLWNNQNVVYLMVPGVRKPWATIHTKRLTGVDLVLNGPKGAFQLGGVAEIGADRSLATDSEDHDQVKLRFVTTDELHSENVAAFFQAHLESLTTQRSLAV